MERASLLPKLLCGVGGKVVRNGVVGHAVVCIPLVLAVFPRQRRGEGVDEIQQCPRHGHNVPNVEPERHDKARIANACQYTKHEGRKT